MLFVTNLTWNSFTSQKVKCMLYLGNVLLRYVLIYNQEVSFNFHLTFLQLRVFKMPTVPLPTKVRVWFAVKPEFFQVLFQPLRVAYSELRETFLLSKLSSMILKVKGRKKKIEDITYPHVDTNFIIECSSRYRLEHEKIKIRIHKRTCNILFII